MPTNLSPLVQSFVLHFGEMGSRWGINRTVGQVYALLYISPKPLCADDIVESLGISRSNVSMSLKELQAWNLAISSISPATGAIFHDAGGCVANSAHPCRRAQEARDRPDTQRAS